MSPCGPLATTLRIACRLAQLRVERALTALPRESPSPCPSPTRGEGTLLESLASNRGQCAVAGLPPHPIALHEARIGRGLQQRAVLGGGGDAAEAPVGVDLHLVAAAAQGRHRRRREAALDRHMARTAFARIERAREVRGVEFRRVDRL